MKRTWTCPKCQSERVGHFDQVLDQGRGSMERAIGEVAAGKRLGTMTFERAGKIEAYVCADCGYFEEYLQDPQDIDWDEMQHFSWCRADD